MARLARVVVPGLPHHERRLGRVLRPQKPGPKRQAADATTLPREDTGTEDTGTGHQTDWHTRELRFL
jgi:hypothetical protein